MSRRRPPCPRAFSLLESLVVMMIILLLASILIAGIMGRGRDEPELPKPKLPDNEKKIEEPEGNETNSPTPSTEKSPPPRPEPAES